MTGESGEAEKGRSCLAFGQMDGQGSNAAAPLREVLAGSMSDRDKLKGRMAAVLVCLLMLGVGVASWLMPNAAAVGRRPAVYASFFSLLPPMVAIALALITKEVYSALFTGVVVGALLSADGNGVLAMNTLLYHESAGLVSNIANVSHASVLLFVVILSALVVLMNNSGGAYAFALWTQSHVKSRIGAQLATIFMGIMIFVDDSFNCLTVGSVMRSITDKYQISRAKLAYLIDSTAAPICIIAPVSCWAAAVTYAIPEGMVINGFQMFLRTIPYNMYAWGTLLFMTLLTIAKVDYGPMLRHEKNALQGDLFTTADRPYSDAEKGEIPQYGRLSNLVIPVVLVIGCCIMGIVYTGGFFSGTDLITAFANSDSAKGLVLGCIVSSLLVFVFYMFRGVMSMKDFMEAFPEGFRSMCAPMIILILSWNLSGITGLLGSSVYIHRVVSDSAASLMMFLPMIIFIISVGLAFATGTSWGTFTILIPIVCALFAADSEMLVISISACLAGAVGGDHCSPISDTTIMSSAGAHCDHINHVTTQLPYALTVVGVSSVGYLLAGVIGFKANNSTALLAVPVTWVLLGLMVFILKKRRAVSE
ncbi:MAG: Na+/H+ antiporter NhaC family protein [bacterium]|nr:Na+/H+ antiporter NhaC family protein [bacterium]